MEQQNYDPNNPEGYQQANNNNNNQDYQNYQNQGGEFYQINKDMNAMFETNSYMNALEKADFAFIKQKVELLEVMTGCETKNRYKVFVRYPDGSNLYLFKAKEDSDCCSRQCCR